MINTKDFEKDMCISVKNFIDPTTVTTISQYFENRILRGEWTSSKEVNDITKFYYYADPLIEVVLKACKHNVETAVKKVLLPTYSYSRIYQPGEELKPHTDRQSCEYSVTVNVANKGGVSPFFTQYQDNPVQEHMLNPGDAIIYKGCEVRHWRNPIEENCLNIQFMLHYVDKYGPYANYSLDKRPDLGYTNKER